MILRKCYFDCFFGLFHVTDSILGNINLVITYDWPNIFVGQYIFILNMPQSGIAEYSLDLFLCTNIPNDWASLNFHPVGIIISLFLNPLQHLLSASFFLIFYISFFHSILSSFLPSFCSFFHINHFDSANMKSLFLVCISQKTMDVFQFLKYPCNLHFFF